MGTIVVERLYDLIAILAIFFVVQPGPPHVSWFGAAAVAALVLAVAVVSVVVVLVVYGERPLRWLLRPLGRLSLFSGDRLERTLTTSHGLSGLRNRRVAIEAFLWTILAWMLTALCAYFVSVAFHLQLPVCVRGARRGGRRPEHDPAIAARGARRVRGSRDPGVESVRPAEVHDPALRAGAARGQLRAVHTCGGFSAALQLSPSTACEVRWPGGWW